MYAHFSGKLAYKSPTMVVIDCQGVGYELHISLNTYEKVKDMEQATLFSHLVVKEDAHVLYGFADELERSLFRQLISVNGIGAATARMILSSLSTNETQQAILQGNVSLLKSVKGVGPKSAQRIILELQDKIGKADVLPVGMQSPGASHSRRSEAVAALQMLGFGRQQIEKAVDVVVAQNKNAEMNVEEMIKQALKKL